MSSGSVLKIKTVTQNQALFYKYRLNRSLSNTFFIYGSYNYGTLNLNYPGVADFGISQRSLSYDSYPHSLGLKNKLKWNYGIHNMEVGMRYDLFFLDYTGQSSLELGETDLAAPSNLTHFGANIINHIWGNYLEDQIQLDNFLIKSAVRLDYLPSNQNLAWDASLSAQYDFKSNTTMFTSASLHESFPQTNYSYFFYFAEQDRLSAIDIVEANHLKPERAVYTLLGFKQLFGNIYSLQVEGFYNLFDRLVRRVRNKYSNNAETRNIGIEITLNKQLEKKNFDYYGWLSYTYLDANLKINSLNNFIPYDFEQEHALKFLLGLKIYMFEVAFRFQVYSGLPYTPIIGSQDRIQNRYTPIFGDQNSKRFKPFHSLDSRFSSNTFTSTSKIRWYFEIYNLYNFKAKNNLAWNYSQPFQQGQNPRLSRKAVIPGSQQNLLFSGGVEVQF